MSLAIPDTTPPGAPPKVTARLTKDGKVHLAWGAATDNGRIAGYRIRRAGKLIASGTALRRTSTRRPSPAAARR